MGAEASWNDRTAAAAAGDRDDQGAESVSGPHRSMPRGCSISDHNAASLHYG